MVKIKYKCNKCKFKFAREDKIAVEVCPYCSSKGTVEIDTGDTAKRLLDEVSRIDRMN